MKQYRIVCDTTIKRDDKTMYLEATTCRYGRSYHEDVYDDKEVAEAQLEWYKNACKEYDDESKNNRCTYKQTNIRIQEREVSDWQDSH